MQRTRNDQPRTPSPTHANASDKENQAPARKATGQHSPLARQVTEDQFLTKTAKTIVKGKQSAAAMLNDPAGLEFVKARLFSVGLVLEHDRGKNTLSAVPVTKFFPPAVAAQHPAPSKKLIKQQLADNAIKVGDDLDEILVDADNNRSQLRRFDVVRAQEASLVLESFVENPAVYAHQLSQDPSLLGSVTRAATHIGISLIYVPEREAPLAVRPRNFLAVSGNNTKKAE